MGVAAVLLTLALLEPQVYELKLVYIFESAKTDFIFVVGDVGFRTVDSLKTFVASLPAGTTLRWAPGCERFGGEPLLSSERDMEAFASFCRAHGVRFVLVPSG